MTETGPAASSTQPCAQQSAAETTPDPHHAIAIINGPIYALIFRFRACCFCDISCIISSQKRNSDEQKAKKPQTTSHEPHEPRATRASRASQDFGLRGLFGIRGLGKAKSNRTVSSGVPTRNVTRTSPAVDTHIAVMVRHFQWFPPLLAALAASGH